MSRSRLLMMFGFFAFLLTGAGSALACGGLFCQTVPVSQQGERIIFTVNNNETITAYVQINYVGEAPDFSWVVPVPSVPEIDVAEMATFDELDTLTQPVILSPAVPGCAMPPVVAMAESAVDDVAEEDGVEVLASGTAGPYGFDVVDSDDPDALIIWLRENDYQVTQEMEPLIAVYNEEGMPFLAMKLQPEAGVQDIQPVVMTYEGTQPMIPIRLTAVAAEPDMNILTWIFANEQAFPENYANPIIPDEDIRGDFMSFGGTNYLQLVDAAADDAQGLAMVTEYAQPTSELLTNQITDPLLLNLAQQYNYLTRFVGRMSPEEMTIDPVFAFDGQLNDVSNVRDLSQVDAKEFWGCTDEDEQNKIPLAGGVAALAGAFVVGGAFGYRRRKQI